MTDLCFLIPTYNRFDRLLRTLNQIEKVFANSKINYQIYIVDNSSNKETFDFFSMNSREKTIYYRREVSIPNGNLSVHQSLLDVNVDAKWYWWLGDDDYVLPESIKFVHYCLQNDQIDYLHATDATFQLSESSIVDFGDNIVSHFGILELTSFMSSQLFTRKILSNLRDKITARFSNFNWDFNFNHSLLISETIWKERCMVSAEGMVIAQNHVHKQSENATTPGAYYQSLRGWFNLADFTEDFVRRLKIEKPINRRLFHYRGRPIWESYVIWILSYLTIESGEQVLEDLQKISNLIRQSDTTSGFHDSLISSLVQLENLRKLSTADFFNKVILPFYLSTLSELRS